MESGEEIFFYERTFIKKFELNYKEIFVVGEISDVAFIFDTNRFGVDSNRFGGQWSRG